MIRYLQNILNREDAIDKIFLVFLYCRIIDKYKLRNSCGTNHRLLNTATYCTQNHEIQLLSHVHPIRSTQYRYFVKYLLQTTI